VKGSRSHSPLLHNVPTYESHHTMTQATQDVDTSQKYRVAREFSFRLRQNTIVYLEDRQCKLIHSRIPTQTNMLQTLRASRRSTTFSPPAHPLPYPMANPSQPSLPPPNSWYSLQHSLSTLNSPRERKAQRTCTLRMKRYDSFEM
jgi:hypothetical protein